MKPLTKTDTYLAIAITLSASVLLPYSLWVFPNLALWLIQGFLALLAGISLVKLWKYGPLRGLRDAAIFLQAARLSIKPAFNVAYFAIVVHYKDNWNSYLRKGRE